MFHPELAEPLPCPLPAPGEGVFFWRGGAAAGYPLGVAALHLEMVPPLLSGEQGQAVRGSHEKSNPYFAGSQVFQTSSCLLIQSRAASAALFLSASTAAIMLIWSSVLYFMFLRN